METLTLERKKTRFSNSFSSEKSLTYETIGDLMAKTTPYKNTPVLGFTAAEQAEFDRGISIHKYI